MTILSMTRVVLLPVLALLAACEQPILNGLLTPTPDAAVATGATCRLTRVIDGDTLVCLTEGVVPTALTVRLLGVDAPEQAQLDGPAARAWVQAALPAGTRLTLEYDREREDRYGRTLAWVTAHDRRLNEALVEAGWAVAFPVAPNLRHAWAVERAEARARAEARGLWARPAPRCLPADFRAERCRS